MPVIILGCTVVGVFARPICGLIFGSEFVDTAPVLVAMLPAVVAILPSYILGFPTLGAMGLSKYANKSIIVGTVTHIVGLTLLALTGNLSAVTLAAMTSVSEWSIMLFRAFMVIKNRKIFTEKGE